MYKSRHNFFKKRNKCEVIIKSTITKRTIAGKKVVETIIIKKCIKIDKLRERERERERVLTFFVVNNLERIGERGGERVLTFFVVNNLERIGERGGNEVKEIYKKIKLEE